MSKGIIALNVPEHCVNCFMLTENNECLAMGTLSINVDPLKEKPDWCPIIECPLPKKKDDSLTKLNEAKEFKDIMDAGIEMTFNRGWNAYIDEMIKRLEEKIIK